MHDETSLAIRSSAQTGRFRHTLTLYLHAFASGHRPTASSLTSLLKSAARRLSTPLSAAALHAHTFLLGHASHVYPSTALITLYARLGSISSARKVFDEMPTRTIVSWNAILAAYGNSGKVMDAKKVFDEMSIRDVVSWNSMVSAYVKSGEMECALKMFEEMPERNAASWNAVLSGWVERGEVGIARELFDSMPEKSAVSWVVMIDGYGRCGDCEAAREIFDGVEGRNVFCWNSMIGCYARNGRGRDALELFNLMRKFVLDDSLVPDEMTFSSVVSACSQLGYLRFGLWVEKYTNWLSIVLDDHLKTAFVDLYAKCGSMGKAFKFFLALRKRDLVSYSAMILGCGTNGRAFDAIRLFKEMLDAKIAPNRVTFVGLLAAYRHAGLVEEGMRCFSSMSKEHCIAPSANHYAIMVDLLGRAGRVEEAYQLIKGMPMEAHVGAWGALLLACRLHGNVKIGEIAARNCFRLEPNGSGYYVLLANIYAECGKWKEAKKLRVMMEEKGLSAAPGCSWVEPG